MSRCRTSQHCRVGNPALTKRRLRNVFAVLELSSARLLSELSPESLLFCSLHMERETTVVCREDPITVQGQVSRNGRALWIEGSLDLPAPGTHLDTAVSSLEKAGHRVILPTPACNPDPRSQRGNNPQRSAE